MLRMTLPLFSRGWELVEKGSPEKSGAEKEAILLVKKSAPELETWNKYMFFGFTKFKQNK